jgi:hypothetical protein
MLAIQVNPNSNPPGTRQLSHLVGGLMTLVLLACVVSVLIGVAARGFGARLDNSLFGHCTGTPYSSAAI